MDVLYLFLGKRGFLSTVINASACLLSLVKIQYKCYCGTKLFSNNFFEYKTQMREWGAAIRCLARDAHSLTREAEMTTECVR